MAFLASFVILFLFWMLMSGRFDYFHLSLGIISCAIVAHISQDLLFTDIKSKKRHIEIIRFLRYLPWLFYQIVLANVYIAYLALHPRMSIHIDPRIIKFKTRLKKELSLVTFGNSITLTPGTITVLIKNGHYYVHAIDGFSAQALPGDMEMRVGHVHMED
jgi:multicomponent Na+:H+ antiporter subunit E